MNQFFRVTVAPGPARGMARGVPRDHTIDADPESGHWEPAASSPEQLGVDHVERHGVIAVPNRRDQVNERPPRHAEEAQPSLADPVPEGRVEYRLTGQALAIVAILALSFLIELTVLGGLRHDHEQAQLATQFRYELAQSIAPVGPLDDAGKPLAAGTPVALLEIPQLGLREIVVEGTSSGTLISGPGHRRDTPLPGQVGTSVIAGRRATYGGPFRSINQLHTGDPITVITGQGRHTFVVIGVRHAGDAVPPALARGHGRLTLVTTDGPALQPTDVLRVDAELTSAAQSRPAQLPSAALPPADAPLAGDTSVLLSIVGWAILLVTAALATVWVRYHIGFWQAWLIGLPTLVALGLTVTDDIAAMLPNLL
jgi:sortase A